MQERIEEGIGAEEQETSKGIEKLSTPKVPEAMEEAGAAETEETEGSQPKK